MIYFLQSPEGGPVKIGHSADLETRRRALENLYQQPLALLATMDGGRDEEREIHSRFAHLRLGRTEQFRPAPELMAFIGGPLLISPDPDAVEVMASTSVAVATLHGTQEQADWLEAARRKTHISKSVIVRLGLSLWAEQNGLPPFPAGDDE